jgi:hypothetical protein
MPDLLPDKIVSRKEFLAVQAFDKFGTAAQSKANMSSV